MTVRGAMRMAYSWFHLKYHVNYGLSEADTRLLFEEQRPRLQRELELRIAESRHMRLYRPKRAPLAGAASAGKVAKKGGE